MNIVFIDAASDSDDKKIIEELRKLRESGEDEEMRKRLTFQDVDLNTALHFGARNGNWKICKEIIEEAKRVNCQIDESRRIDLVHTLINCRNAKGFTPLIECSFRGYQTLTDKDGAVENRHKIIRFLTDAGANPDYCKQTSKMTALHWCAYNNDREAIKALLKVDANPLCWSHND